MVNDRKIILIGEPDSKRTEFFIKAGNKQRITVNFFSWSDWRNQDMEGGFVKIDPPSFAEYNILTLTEKIKEYQEQLQELEEMGKEKGICFLNPPSAILQLLDKVACKEKLQEHNIPVTTMIGKNPKNFQELKAIMKEKKCWSVFLKPVYGSGAAGILALSMQPVTGKLAAYTAVCVEQNRLLQQKKIRKITKEREIDEIVNAVTSLDTIVERWYPKAGINKESFDFRVLWQFDRMEFIVARKSASPITNLHLNNGAISLEELFKTQASWNHNDTLKEMEELCRNAMAVFPQVQMAGLDVMLDRKTGKPRIIEMNGQGDLLYQDIYGENQIYTSQIAYMQSKLQVSKVKKEG